MSGDKWKTVEYDINNPFHQGLTILLGGWLIRMFLWEILGWVVWIGGGVIMVYINFIRDEKPGVNLVRKDDTKQPDRDWETS